MTDCEKGDLYFAAAEALVAAADSEPNATDAISDMKQAAQLFEKAAECYTACADARIADHPLEAHEAYHKAVISHRAAERREELIEGYYKSREAHEDYPLGPDRPATQHGKAEKRRKEDAQRRAESEARERQARQGYLAK